MVFSQLLESWKSHLAEITKTDKEFAKKLDFKDIKFPVKIRDIRKIEKYFINWNFIDTNVFGHENKEKYPSYIWKQCCKEKHVDLLLIGEEGKRHYPRRQILVPGRPEDVPLQRPQGVP